MQQTRTILIPLFRRMVYRPHDTESRLATGVVRRETDCRVCIASLLLLPLLLPCCLGIDCSSQRRQVVFSNSTGLALIPAQLCDTDSASSTDAQTTTQYYQHPITNFVLQCKTRGPDAHIRLSLPGAYCGNCVCVEIFTRRGHAVGRVRKYCGQRYCGHANLGHPH